MSDSRDNILGRLRSYQSTEPALDNAPREYVPMVPRSAKPPRELWRQFIREASKVDCMIHRAGSDAEAVSEIGAIIADDQKLASWEFRHLPLSGLEVFLRNGEIKVASPSDPSVRVGLTGADAALAATGSIVLETGRGKPRASSILPPVHVVVIRETGNILPDLETWMDQRRKHGLDSFQKTSSFLVVTGPSRTADIAMEPVRGMHGPGELHIVIIDD